MLDIFIDVDTEIKRVLIGDHKIKQQILAMETSLFLKILPAIPEYKWF